MMASTTQDMPGSMTGAGAQGTGTPDPARTTTEQTGGQAQDNAQQAFGQAQDKAQHASDKLQARLRDEIEQRSSQAAEQIQAQTSDLRAVSESLREQGKDGPADVADRLAGYAQRVGDYLRESHADSMLADAEDLGRRRPWAATAGGLALGLAASRFLKASSRDRYASRDLYASRDRYPSRGGASAPYASTGNQLSASVGNEAGAGTGGAAF